MPDREEMLMCYKVSSHFFLERVPWAVFSFSEPAEYSIHQILFKVKKI